MKKILKNSISIWKKIKIYQAINNILLFLFILPFFMILGFLLMIILDNSQLINPNIKDILEYLISNPIGFILIFLLLSLVFVFIILLIGSISKSVFDYKEGTQRNNKILLIDTLKKIKSLSLIGISSLFIALIPLQILILFLIPIKAIALSLIGSNAVIDLNLIWDVFEAVTFSLIFAIVAGPGLMSISEVFCEKWEYKNFLKIWKEFLRKPKPIVSSMMLVWILFMSFFLFSRFLLINLLEIILPPVILIESVLLVYIIAILILVYLIITPLSLDIIYITYRTNYNHNFKFE